MNHRHTRRTQLYFTAAATIYIALLLSWEHTHGGVVSHHILHRSDLPAISNWWGLLLLPALTWFLAGCILRARDQDGSKVVTARLVGSLIYGAVLSAAFLNGLENITSLMGPGLLVLALFLPIYRAGYVLGFILCMTYTFGAILPSVFAGVIAALAYVIYRFVRPIPKYLISKVT